MANYIPPLEILPIFDVTVYSEANGYLTPSVANKRYLRFPIAQGNETFPFGLTTDQISAITTGGTIYFYDNLTGIIYIARNVTNTYIGNSTSLTTIQSINAHNTSTSSDLYASSTGTLNIGNLTSIINVGINNAGNINLGSNTSTINIPGSLKNSFISNYSPTLPVNLWTDTTTGLISIGNAGNTGQMVLYGSKVNIYNTTTQSIQALNTGNDVNLFTTSVSPSSINIGAVGTTINLNGSVVVSSISSQNIVSPVPSLPSNIYTSTTSTVTIGSSSGIVTIPALASLINPRYNGPPISFVENSNLIAPTSWITDNFGHKFLVNVWTQPQYMDGGMVSNAFYTNSPTAIGNIFSNTTGAINIGYTSSAIGIGQAQGPSSTIIIGATTNTTTTMYGTTNIDNPKYTGTALTSTENSSAIPPTSWITSYFGKLAIANTWALAQSFTTSVLSQTIDCITAATTASLFASSTGTVNLSSKSNNITIGNNQSLGSIIGIGTTTNTTTTMRGTTNITIPKYTGTALTSTENSTTIPPTSWVQSYFGSLSVANTWALAQTFTTSVKSQIIDCITAATTASLFDSSTGITNICNNANDIEIGNSQPVTSTIAIGTTTNTTTTMNGITNIINPRNTGATLLVSNNSTTMPPTSWINTYFGKLSVANTWALAQTFSTSVKSQIFDCITAATTASLFDSSTGTTNICNNSNDINIGASQPASSTVSFGTNSNSTVYINGTLRSQSIFAPLASLATTSGVFSTNTGTINIGSATAEPTVRGTLILNKPMTQTFTPTATLPFGYATNQIGYSFVYTSASRGPYTANTFTRITSFDITPGVWLFNAGCTTGAGVSNYNFLGFTTLTTIQYPGASNIYNGSSVTLNPNATGVFTVSTTTTYWLSWQGQTTQTITGVYWTVTRIA